MLRNSSDSRLPVSPVWTGLLSEKIAARHAPPAPRAGWEEDVKQLHAGQVLLPSGTLANEAMRVRNNGRRIGRQSPSAARLSKSASESKMYGMSNTFGSSSLPSAGLQGIGVYPILEAKTPRTLRGAVRKNSAVTISYPAIIHGSQPVRWCAGNVLKLSQDAKVLTDTKMSQSDPGPLSLEGSRKEASPRPNTAGSTKKANTTAKRVSWADKVDQGAPLTVIEKEGTPSKARQRSMMLLDNLYKLRRVGGTGTESPPAPAPPAPAPPADAEGVAPPPVAPEARPATPGDALVGEVPVEAPEDKEQLTLMNQILTGISDTESELRTTEAQLEAAQEPVSELGGARHATTLVSGRTLMAVKRKAELLHTAETQLTGFEAAHAQREELRKGVREGTATVPAEYQGVKQFIARIVHRDLNGNRASPVDADKTHFEAFASSFGLLADHDTLVRLNALAWEATEWWAEATLQDAWSGADAFQLQRLIDVTVGFLSISHHAKLTQVTVILGDRLSEKCLDSANRLKEKDASIAARSGVPRPESAREAADKIDEEIREAVALGAPSGHAMLKEAKNIAVALHGEEKIRHALKALVFAEKAKEKDTAMAEQAAPNVPPVGPATEAAEAIDREIRDAIKKGALESHQHIVDAKAVAKHLRDEDGIRKRMAAREKRLAAKDK